MHEHDEGYSYAYGPKGLAGLRHNYFALLCAVFASIGGLTFGYDQGVIANVLVMKDFNSRWPIGPWEKGVMSTSQVKFNKLTSVRIDDNYSIQRRCWSLGRCLVHFLLGYSPIDILEDILYFSLVVR